MVNFNENNVSMATLLKSTVPMNTEQALRSNWQKNTENSSESWLLNSMVGGHVASRTRRRSKLSYTKLSKANSNSSKLGQKNSMN